MTEEPKKTTKKSNPTKKTTSKKNYKAKNSQNKNRNYQPKNKKNQNKSTSHKTTTKTAVKVPTTKVEKKPETIKEEVKITNDEIINISSNEEKVTNPISEPETSSTLHKSRKEKIKNEKWVISIIILIIISLLTGIIYVVATNQKEENRIKKYAEESQNAANEVGESESTDFVPGTVEYKNITEITYDELIEFNKKGQSFILLISSRSCNACSQYQPNLSKVLVDLDKKAYRIETTKLSEEDKKALGLMYSLESTPTTIIISKGKEKEQVKGYMNIEDTKEWIEENI